MHRPVGAIRDYHAHVYYDPATTRADAENLRDQIGAPRDDHLVHALWLGEPLAIRGEVLGESEA